MILDPIVLVFLIINNLFFSLKISVLCQTFNMYLTSINDHNLVMGLLPKASNNNINPSVFSFNHLSTYVLYVYVQVVAGC